MQRALVALGLLSERSMLSSLIVVLKTRLAADRRVVMIQKFIVVTISVVPSRRATALMGAAEAIEFPVRFLKCTRTRSLCKIYMHGDGCQLVRTSTRRLYTEGIVTSPCPKLNANILIKDIHDSR